MDAENSTPTQWVTVKEAARRMQITDSHVYKLRNIGLLSTRRRGKRVYISSVSIEQYLAGELLTRRVTRRRRELASGNDARPSLVATSSERDPLIGRRLTDWGLGAVAGLAIGLILRSLS